MLLVATIAVLVGITLGLLGGGGTILTVPALVYLLAVPTKPAIATSLFVVAATSAASLAQHARSGLVRWRVGLWFGGAAMVGAYAGGRLGALLDPTILLLSFGAMMLATATAMLMRRNPAPRAQPARVHGWPTIVAEGLLVGAVTGMVGAGGGFLVVPALVLLGGLTMQEAIGTSLLVIALKSSAGLAGYLGRVEIDWSIALPMAAFAIAGSVIGTRLARRLPQEILRTVFAVFVLVMGIVMVLAELH